MKKIIHIDQNVIKSNVKTGKKNPVIVCKTDKDNKYGHEVLIKGESRVVYKPEKPLLCGATVWIETDGEVKVLSE
jgi:hypothetical protein